MQQGATTGDMMRTLAEFPGSIYGTPQDMLSLFGTAPALSVPRTASEAPGQANTAVKACVRLASSRASARCR